MTNPVFDFRPRSKSDPEILPIIGCPYCRVDTEIVFWPGDGKKKPGMGVRCRECGASWKQGADGRWLQQTQGPRLSMLWETT